MGRKWNKKRVIRLQQADAVVAEQWLDEFIHVIYTWLYYQVGADADIAAKLTAGTFERAIRKLAQFNPDSETMLQWLRDQAKMARDEGLAVRQMQPQRPWAWSQLPDGVLCGLSRFRNEPLPEDVINNPFVREIVQASLAEMETPNRELMMYRYNRLETSEQIANQTGKNVQEINDRLYRCRHFFRRVFVQLIQAANPGFSEPSSPGSLELLDVNLEKLLSATNMVQTINPREQAKIREIVIQTALETIPEKKTVTPQKAVIGIAAGAALLVLFLFGIFAWFTVFAPSSVQPPGPVTPVTAPQAQTPATASPPPVPQAEEIDEDELRRIFRLRLTGDLAGLLEILKNGDYTSQRTAALFIGQIGDESAIGMLEEAEMQRFPNGPADNPFSQAIVQIEDRLLAESDTFIEEPNETETDDTGAFTAADEPADEVPDPVTVEPGIGGMVTDFSGQPVPDAVMTLSANPLYNERTDRQVLGQITTDADGEYRFNSPPAGAFFVDCRSELNGLAISRAVWYEQQSDCTVHFGGAPAVFGSLDNALEINAEQVLYLSDTLNPANAAFRAESMTDTEGQFSFTGIQPGNYYLLRQTETGRIVRLSNMSFDNGETVERNISVPEAAVTVSVGASDNMPAILDVVLSYGTDVSGELEQFPLTLQDDGTYFSDRIPYGEYILIGHFENSMRLQQSLELNSDRTLNISVPDGSSLLSGSFNNPSPYLFFLYNSNQRVRFDLAADADGLYALDMIPPDSYTLAAVVNNLQLDFMDIDLQNEPELVLDIDAGELLEGFSPVYVVVTDAEGLMLSDAQVWVTGPGEVITTQSTGRGAFLALPPGEYTLFAALPGYSTAEQVIQVQPMPLETPPNSGNTFALELNLP